MVRSSVFVICLISILAFNFVDCSNSADNAFEPKVELKFVQNMTDFLADNPGVKLQQLANSETSTVRPANFHLVHRLGHRINGDRLLTTDSASEHWAYPEDKKINLSYPINGESAEVITYLEVFTEQSTNLGNVYVIGGGIGQRRIDIVIEAKHTVFWRYRASIYGH